VEESASEKHSSLLQHRSNVALKEIVSDKDTELNYFLGKMKKGVKRWKFEKVERKCI
jgi:hypothetical protein